MCQLGMNWHVGSISELFQNNLSGDNMPPLYHLFAALWLRVAPYGTFWLKLPSEIAVAAGVYVCGLCGNHLKGARLGLLTSLFACLLYTSLAGTDQSQLWALRAEVRHPLRGPGTNRLRKPNVFYPGKRRRMTPAWPTYGELSN